MKVIKPQRLGILPKPYSFRGHHYLCVATLVFFRLGYEDAEAAVLPEHSAWPDVCRALPPGTPLDFGMPKLRGEVLLAGAACTPGAEPQRRLSVRLQLGGIDKQLVVHGDRQWQYGLIPSYQHTAPAQFTRLPLTFDRAFGGPGFASNELGKGYHTQRFEAWVGPNHGPLPNVEYPGEPVQAGARAFRPASFLPLDFNAPERKRKAGTYDERWLKQDFPGYARDLDWSLFNAAPVDQWLPDTLAGPALFQGGEDYRLEHLHPRHAVLRGRLPRLRARTFLSAADDACRELASRADTVWFFPELELGALIFHASAEVQDDEALDVRGVMVAYELAESAPRPFEHYREVFRLRSDKETAGLHAFNESQLCPPRERPSPELRQAEQQALAQASVGDTLAELREAGVPLPADFVLPAPEPAPFMAPSPEEIASGDFDLTDMISGARATARALEEEGERQLESVRNQAASPPAPDSSAAVSEALARADGSSVRDQLLALSATAGPPDPTALTTLRDQLERLPTLAPQPPAAATAQEVGAALGDYVRRVLREGGSLRRADLTGAHLRDLDLSGCDLEGVGLAWARLERVRLDGTRLSGASFAHARLEDVSLRSAELPRADLSGAQLIRCSLASAQLQGSQWRQTQAYYCDLSGCTLEAALFQSAQLERCSFASAEMRGGAWVQTQIIEGDFHQLVASQSSFLECRFEAADFRQSRLTKVTFLSARAHGARFDGAQLSSVFFGGGSALPGARFCGTCARDCGFRGADLTNSDFTGATLSRSDLALAQLDGARFDASLVSRCGLRQTRGRGASFVGADLYHSAATKADWTGADFRDASLYRLEARGALWTGADLHGAAPLPQHGIVLPAVTARRSSSA